MDKMIFSKKNDSQRKTLLRKIDEIKKLKSKISELEIDCKKKDEMIHQVDDVYEELLEIMDSLREKHDEYENLINELKDMKAVMNEVVFKGKWKFVKFLMK